MGWVGRVKDFIKIMLFALFAFIGQSAVSYALEQWEEDINTLLLERKFDEAFALVNKQKTQDSPVIYQYKGLLLGSGVLSTGKDLCGAIDNLEKAYVSWKFLLKDLDFLYGGDWASIAAIEGNSEALFDVGQRIRYTKKSMALTLFYDGALGIKESYKYYFNAAVLGHEEAKKKMVIIERKYPDINFAQYEKKIEFKEIYCPVRKY